MARENFTDLYARQPYSLEAEQAILGSIIIEPKCLSDVAVSVKSEYFYLPQHKDIYTIISSMYELNQTIDYVSLLEKLKQKGTYDEDGGKAYLSQLIQCVPSTANIASYISIVRDKYYSRALMNAANDILKDIEDNELESAKLLDSAEQRIYEIRSGREVSGLTHIKSVIENETFDRLAKITNPDTKEQFKATPTGISDLDRMITGLNKSDLIILGARPGMGKTSFALNLARNVAVNAGKTVCFFSLEMTRDQLAQRMLSSEAGIKSEKFRTGEIEPDEWTTIAKASEHLSKANIYFDESSNITVPEMKAKLRRMKDVGLVVIDYLGLMHTPRPNDNRVQEISEITRSLKIMAKELNIPIIACAQLSRGTEQKGKSHKPALADLRDSGSIEQDADIVLFLYRESYYDSEKSDEDNTSNPHNAECIVAKNRHGEIGTVELYWDGQFTRFTGIDWSNKS